MTVLIELLTGFSPLPVLRISDVTIKLRANAPSGQFLKNS